MDNRSINAALFDFLDSSPVSYFAVRNMKKMLKEAGFTELCEGNHWELEEGGRYYVSRDDSALIAFRIPKRDFIGFQLMASHCDSPVFRIKPNAEIVVENKYVKLNVEKYGGMMCAPWMDRPLSVAGRVIVETGDGIETRLVNIERDLLIIPNVAIHMNREVNEGYKINVQVDMLPLLGEICDDAGREGTGNDSRNEAGKGTGNDSRNDAGKSVGKEYAEKDAGKSAGKEYAEKDGGTKYTLEKKASAAQNRFLRMIAGEAGVSPEQILDTDLFLYNRMKAGYVGMDEEFITSGRLDDLQCAFASIQGFLRAEPGESVAVHCVFDTEEVGSSSKQGAAGTFLADVLYRINAGLGRTREEYLRAMTSSFMVSADNAHAVHPNHPEKADPTNRPYMNGGIVIKYSFNQKYSTDGISGAIFRTICKKAGVPYQTFTNRSDMIGGSTLGSISQRQVSLNMVDVGLAQLAMHSPYETAGSRDTAYLAEAARILFSGSVQSAGDGNYTLKF